MKLKLRIGFSIIWTSLLFALFQSIRNMLAEPVWKPFLIFLVLFLLLAVFCFSIFKIASHSRIGDFLYSAAELERRMEKALNSTLSDTTFFFHLWILLTICYIPAYLALFPGTFGYDSPIQAAQYFGDLELTSLHPLAHTFLLGGFFSLGEKLFHSFFTGFAFYTAFQGIAVTGSAAYSLTVCKKHRVPFPCILLAAFWFAFNPYLQILSFNSTKDILFGAFLLGFTTACWDFLECDEPRKSQHILLIIFGILMCLFRNQGIYILAAQLLLCLILRCGKKGFYLCLAAVLLLSQGFFTVSSAGLHIPKGDSREMLCVPIQQMALAGYSYLNGNRTQITREQMEILNQIIPPEGLLAYEETTADPVKNYFQTDALKKNLMTYIKNYISIGLQNPHEYLYAWLYLIHPYWEPSDNSYKSLTYSYTFTELNQWGIQYTPKFDRYYNTLVDKLYDTDEKLHNRPDLCLWLLAGLSGFAIARGRKKLFLGILPLAFYLGTMVLGPVALLRYLYPLTLATPLLLCLFFLPSRSKERW